MGTACPGSREPIDDVNCQPYQDVRSSAVIDDFRMACPVLLGLDGHYSLHGQFIGNVLKGGDTVAIITMDDMLRRISGEYLEMPGLRLARPQAQRLWGLDRHTCSQLLDSLVEAKFLRRTDDGMYARLTDGAVAAPPLRMAAAEPARISQAVPRAAASARQ